MLILALSGRTKLVEEKKTLHFLSQVTFLVQLEGNGNHLLKELQKSRLLLTIQALPHSPTSARGTRLVFREIRGSKDHEEMEDFFCLGSVVQVIWLWPGYCHFVEAIWIRKSRQSESIRGSLHLSKGENLATQLGKYHSILSRHTNYACIYIYIDLIYRLSMAGYIAFFSNLSSNLGKTSTLETRQKA